MNAMSLSEIMIMQLGHNRKREQELRNTRLIMWSVFQKGNKRKITPEKIIKLPSDMQKVRDSVISKEDYMKLKELWKPPTIKK